jgi:hypothetical protein
VAEAYDNIKRCLGKLQIIGNFKPAMKNTFTVIGIVLLMLEGIIESNASTWMIGATQSYTLPGQVSSLVQDGDTILIEPGVYPNDAVKWTKNHLTFIGLGTGSNRTILRYTGDIPNGKGIFVFENPLTGSDAYIENIVFDGAQVSDADGANGAGIRYQANNLMVVSCKFMNCQNGILEGNGTVSTSNVTILNSEFENNGYQLPNDPNYSGYEHHIYISASTDTLVVQNCYFHDPRGQANSIKTRAQRSFILYNMIDEANGYGSWELDIAQGGLNILVGNVIIQGTSGANHGMIGYDAATNQLEDLYFINNTVINKYSGNIKYFNVAPSTGINTFKINNNIFASVNGASNAFITGNTPASLDSAGNIFEADYANMAFTNTNANDFSLTTLSSAIDAGVNAGSTNSGYTLDPASMYLSFDSILQPRLQNGLSIDAGAYEFQPAVSVNDFQEQTFGSINIKDHTLTFLPYLFHDNEKIRIDIYTLGGDNIFTLNDKINHRFDINISGWKGGIYLVRISGINLSETYKISW